MSEIRSPGQLAYEAYLAARYPKPSTLRDVFIPWEDVSLETQAAWEAAAQAVLARRLPLRRWTPQKFLQWGCLL